MKPLQDRLVALVRVAAHAVGGLVTLVATTILSFVRALRGKTK